MRSQTYLDRNSSMAPWPAHAVTCTWERANNAAQIKTPDRDTADDEPLAAIERNLGRSKTKANMIALGLLGGKSGRPNALRVQHLILQPAHYVWAFKLSKQSQSALTIAYTRIKEKLSAGSLSCKHACKYANRKAFPTVQCKRRGCHEGKIPLDLPRERVITPLAPSS